MRELGKGFYHITAGKLMGAAIDGAATLNESQRLRCALENLVVADVAIFLQGNKIYVLVVRHNVGSFLDIKIAPRLSD